MANEARGAARQAAGNEWLERLARFGMIGYGVTHLLVGWIALQLAFGKAAKEGDQSGAFKTLADGPLGKFLLVAVAIGLAAMVLWQVLEAAVGHTEDTGKERVFERVASVFKAGFYAYLAFKAVQVLQGSGKSSGDQQQQTTGTVLESTGGRWIVGLVGLAVAIIGAGLVWYGVTKRFEKHLKTGQMDAKVRKTTRGLGVSGYAAKGTVYGVVGILVLTAAVNYDPGKSRGLDQALHTLAEQPAGDFLLIAVALGLVAYGAFCFAQAKYRKV
ncbi:DUF1206 domain-containing protein [Virgisporangium aliadipatigenens]|uniref:DUF1206 domain-containing protein n=1 Tax=Virgisporangium aliadipatigenens TaxID=741659 RepID=UPI0027E546A7|nr:DUF1206 domain-containing protein [Virgisporangium aliadipatigenens]